MKSKNKVNENKDADKALKKQQKREKKAAAKAAKAADKRVKKTAKKASGTKPGKDKRVAHNTGKTAGIMKKVASGVKKVPGTIAGIFKKKPKDGRKKAKISIKLEILFLTLLPLIVMAVIIALYAHQSMQKSIADQALNGLKDLCYSVKGTYDTLDSDMYEMNGDYLRKGQYEITKNEKMLENFVHESDAQISLYYGDKVVATSLTSHLTGKKIHGVTAPESIVKTVVDGKEEYSTSKDQINDDKYYSYYIPLKNPGGAVVGMIWAGKPAKSIDKSITESTTGILLVSVIILVLAAILVLVISNRLGQAIRKAEGMLGNISEGNLNVAIDKKIVNRKDELGLMAQALSGLMNELQGVIRSVKDSSVVLADAGQNLNDFANSTRQTADEINSAVGDISKGALTQVEDTENAMNQVDYMGNTIDQIVNRAGTLFQTSEAMEISKNDAEEIISQLTVSSEKTYEAVRSIERQVNLTDESVGEIQEAVKLISSIASETNLLSLNASIEAARAGEAGKGFAVVATEIQKLADESSRSAKKIGEVIKNLSAESKNTVDAMESIHAIIEEQQTKLQQTKDKFEDVSQGIQSSMNEIKEIRNDSNACGGARVQVTDAIRSLSAVAEQNAAATEQTTASMDELNKTMSILAEKADELGVLANSMQERLEFFKL